MNKFVLFMTILASLGSFAGEHDLTDIEGKDINLKLFDHAIAGSIKDFVVFGNKDDATNISELTIKKDAQIIKASFKKNESSFGGRILHTDLSRNIRSSQIEFVKWDTDLQKIYITINGEMVETIIKADDFQNSHFINPHYFVSFSNGEKFDFKILNGQACYNFSAHLIMMIAGAYSH